MQGKIVTYGSYYDDYSDYVNEYYCYYFLLAYDEGKIDAVDELE